MEIKYQLQNISNTNDYKFGMFKLLSILLNILLLTHYIACLEYLVGYKQLQAGIQHTWIENEELLNETTFS